MGGAWQFNSHALPPPPPPPTKGVWCSGCHSPRINQGASPEMGLIKGVVQGKGRERKPTPLQCQPTYQSTMSGMLGARAVNGVQSQGEGIGDMHERVIPYSYSPYLQRMPDSVRRWSSSLTMNHHISFT